ncbi:hypothetical protein [Amycolatopsis sp. cg13]|uniref:hypothetical protein n=1 Tax=Amycolatopsis sp. cg13 TaxID=3238807 RepID=UPI003523B637
MRGKIAFDPHLRRTSSAESLPWLARTVTLLRVGEDGLVTQAKTDSEKRAMLGTATGQELLVVAWPGEWSQDLFVVDDLPAARLAVGLPRRRVATAEPAGERYVPSLSRDWSPSESRDLWACLAGLPDLPAEGKRQLVDKEAERVSARRIKPLLAREDLDREARQRLLAGVEWWDAGDLVADDCCSDEEALELLSRFPAKASVLAAALRRENAKQAAMHKIAELSGEDAAELWWDAEKWPAEAKAQLASSVVDAVLRSRPAKPSAEVPGWHNRRDPESLLRNLIEHLPPSRRGELLAHPEHGPRIQRAFLAAGELADAELLECLPEVKAAEAADLLAYLKRFPQLVELARDETGDAVAKLVADGWDPEQAARTGQWADLAAVARAANTSACIDALVRAAVVEGRPGPRVAYYRFVDLIAGNRAASPSQLRNLLDRLPDDHILDIEEQLPARSRTRRLCSEILAAREPRAVSSAKPAPPEESLPTDEELSTVADPQAVLADLLRDRSRNRDAVVAHVLESAYMTDEFAWRMPVREIERHPVYGPRLAAKVIEICGDSPSRWQALAAAWGAQTQLLTSTLFKRIEV